MTTGKLPTTTVHQSRLQIYSPLRYPVYCTRYIVTAWGTARIVGKIGQPHADIVEAMCYNAIDRRFTANGSMQLLIDPYVIRKSIGGGKEYSSTTFKRIIDEIMAAVIELKILPCKTHPKGRHTLCHIISEVDISRKKISNPLSSIQGRSSTRFLWCVTLSEPYAQLLMNDLPLNYDPISLTHIKKGVSQAIARFLLGHSKDSQPNGGWCVNSLIEAVGATGMLKKRRSEIRGDAENLAELGLIVDENGDKITRL